MSAVASKYVPVGWHETVSMERVIQLIGTEAVARARTALHPIGFCLSRAAGYWDANERESHVAYRSLAALLEAEETGAGVRS